eukprot:376083_1
MIVIKVMVIDGSETLQSCLICSLWSGYLHHIQFVNQTVLHQSHNILHVNAVAVALKYVFSCKSGIEMLEYAPKVIMFVLCIPMIPFHAKTLCEQYVLRKLPTLRYYYCSW